MNATVEQARAIEAVRSQLKESIDWNSVNESILGMQVGVIVVEYINHWFISDFDRYRTIAIEGETIHDIVNPATGRPSTIFDHASKLDGLADDLFNAETVVVEHKSTTEELSEWSPYWRRLRIDSQVSKYLLSMRQDGLHECRTVLYDVISKPTTKPKRVVASDVPKIVESGEYHGFKISEPELDRVKAVYDKGKGPKGGFKGKLEESLELYGHRLRRGIVDDPKSTFQRRTITRTDEELEEYARELWQLAAEKRAARKSGVHPKNTTACNSYNRLCEFFPICCGEIDAKSSDRFEVPDFVHLELDSDKVRAGAKNGGRDILTNSRLTTFQSCRQREYLRYEVGLREAGKTTSVALNWGRLFHDLLETVWGFYLKRESNSYVN